jgi:tetratricopeptide (TPR) repeat protein
MQVHKLDSRRVRSKGNVRVAKDASGVKVLSLKTYVEENAEHALELLKRGDLLLSEGDFAQSSEFYRRAAEVYSNLGVGHELLCAIALRSLAHALMMKGSKSEAKFVLKEATELIRDYQ